jgi:hypothetical protein
LALLFLRAFFLRDFFAIGCVSLSLLLRLSSGAV